MLTNMTPFTPKVIGITTFRQRFWEQAKDLLFQFNIASVKTIPYVAKDRRGTGEAKKDLSQIAEILCYQW